MLRILTRQKWRHFEDLYIHPCDSYRFIHPSIGGSSGILRVHSFSKPDILTSILFNTRGDSTSDDDPRTSHGLVVAGVVPSPFWYSIIYVYIYIYTHTHTPGTHLSFVFPPIESLFQSKQGVI